MERFQNKYRIASARAAWWDYGWAGAYFITICTAQRHHYFGNINQGRMQLSSVGILADVFWHEIRHHAQQLELGTFVVMPNHIHGILILNNDDGNNVNANVETRHALSLPPTPLSQRFQNQGKNTVSSIIGGYKSAVTKHAHRLGFDFGWQARFHDHIIRNDAEYQRINDYIEQNPERWDGDKFYTT
ncbi:transposase [Spirosoma sp. SC4-14]|uniref:transposase n=1 Tax=Spirosoma sp. SC4-14 TaxID=3128900 RepID=UPI0030D46AD2